MEWVEISVRVKYLWQKVFDLFLSANNFFINRSYLKVLSSKGSENWVVFWLFAGRNHLVTFDRVYERSNLIKSSLWSLSMNRNLNILSANIKYFTASNSNQAYLRENFLQLKNQIQQLDWLPICTRDVMHL